MSKKLLILDPATRNRHRSSARRREPQAIFQQNRGPEEGTDRSCHGGRFAAEREFRARTAGVFRSFRAGRRRGKRRAWGVAHPLPLDRRPADGTPNFAHGRLFACPLRSRLTARSSFGVVYDPIADELFTAERGGGARLNGQLIHVSDRATLLDGLLCTGFPYSIRERPQRQVEVFASFLGRARAVRRLGSAALDLSYVAAGRFDGFWELQLHPWDMAAGALIVSEAGGRVTNYSSQPIDLFGGQIVVSNGCLHEDMLAIIKDAAR